MTKEKNPILSDHFAHLKELLPEVYAKHFKEERETKNQKLFRMLKHSLGVIEAMYLQNTEGFSRSKAHAYGQIITELQALGYPYTGHPDLMEKASDTLLMGEKKPMKKAKGVQPSDKDTRRKAI